MKWSIRSWISCFHAKLGDFWWYSMMIFCASRIADVMNVFVGLWLVPKYVNLSELGALMPLTWFSTFLMTPIAAFTTVFTKEIITLATRGEFGKMKTLMRSVFWAAAGFLILAVVISHLLMPLFLERIRVVKGSLGILVLATAFLNAVSPIYGCALQALKKFKTMSLLGIVGAPIRFATMLVAMPFRPISGYFVGQMSNPIFGIFASLVALRKELSVRAAPYWSKSVVRKFGLLFLGVLAYQISQGLVVAVEQTVLRQRLPDVESAAYYMVTRFSDISTFFSGVLIITLFPYTAELAERGKSTFPYVIKTTLASIVFCAVLAIFFLLFGRQMLHLLPNGDATASYYWAIAWCVMINALSVLTGIHVSTEISAARFGFLKWWIPIHLLYPLFLMIVTGWGYFVPYCPDCINNFMAQHPVNTLTSILWWFTIIAAIRMAFALCDLLKQYKQNSRQVIL